MQAVPEFTLEMQIIEQIKSAVKAIFLQSFQAELEAVDVVWTKKDQEGDLTVHVFPMLRYVKMNPQSLSEQIGKELLLQINSIESFEAIKGFLNLKLKSEFWITQLQQAELEEGFGHIKPDDQRPAVMVEYSSPNTNKPLHLGHIRNNLLGYSVAKIIEASGRKVLKTQVINDRGIHICKSMLAWQKFGNGATPENTGKKGDKLVGEFYVLFDKKYKAQVEQLQKEGMPEAIAKTEAPILKEAQLMLQQWESGDKAVIELWKTMNQWVYKGFEATYQKLGVDFDSYYYESDTYLIGKDFVEKGLKSGVFYRKADNSVWCDLTDEGLDEKLVLRADGTAVYMTQDIGTAIRRFEDFDIDSLVYTVGNEQDYHFKVLFLILKKLGFDWAKNLYHLSYGMVDLPSGKMKSREGTVVDADDLMEEMKNTAEKITSELGKIDDFSQEEKDSLFLQIGLGALKYFILKVDPKKRILFNPEESIDFQGNTGPFIQYSFARIQSLLKKASPTNNTSNAALQLDQKETDLIKTLMQYPQVVQQAAEQYSPALIANYLYETVKLFNAFYQSLPILKAETEIQKNFRLSLAKVTGMVINKASSLLGMQLPERM